MPLPPQHTPPLPRDGKRAVSPANDLTDSGRDGVSIHRLHGPILDLSQAAARFLFPGSFVFRKSDGPKAIGSGFGPLL